MGPRKKQLGEREERERFSALPESGRTEAFIPACIGELLALACAAEEAVSQTALLEQMLNVILALEPKAAIGLVMSREPCRKQAAQVLWRANISLDRPKITNARLFSELPLERVMPLPGTASSSLHLATTRFEQLTEESCDALLAQAAAVLALVIRAGRGRERQRRLEAHVVQLEKLSTIGRSAASIVHELNNPLTAIIAYSDYLGKRLQNQEVESTDLERLTRIQEAANRIQQMSRDIVDYSRPTADLLMPVDLHAVIDRALGFCMHALRGADITVERSYRDIPTVEGIESPLTQVFVNLFTNATHAMVESGGTLSVRTRAESEQIMVEVADDGPGIDGEHLAQVFDSYFTTKPRGIGMGLGLSIVKQIIGDHGGEIRAENRQNSGAVFYIELPVRSMS